MRNEGPQYDIGYYKFKENALKKRMDLDFWDLDFDVIERRTFHQNLTGDILALFREHSIDVLDYNSKWLKSICKDKDERRNIGFGMAASQVNKRWPTAKWIELANRIITNTNQNIILFPGKSEGEIKDAIYVCEQIGKKRCKIIYGQSLKNVALQIGELFCFVSNDTGLLHLAAAINIPTVGLYVNTKSEIWSPYDKINFTAFQNSFIKKCPDQKSYCGNCFHYYEICPAIKKYGDDIDSDKVYITIFGFLDKIPTELTYKDKTSKLYNKHIENFNIASNKKEGKTMVRKRIRLAQNFFRNSKLVASIVENSSINKNDVVYEIGPGNGIITDELAKRADKIIAVEKDTILTVQLRNKFHNKTNVKIQEADFLKYGIKDKNYKIFSNIPFNITAEIVKKILFGENPPGEAYLVIQKEAAEKFSGIPNETEVSVLAKPWFKFELLHKFHKIDFEPAPSVDVVFLRITKLEKPLVSSENAWKYRKFVQFGFGTWKKDLKTAYDKIFTYEQWKRLSKNLSFPIKAVPTELTFKQWLGLFEYFLVGVVDSKKTIVLSK